MVVVPLEQQISLRFFCLRQSCVWLWVLIVSATVGGHGAGAQDAGAAGPLLAGELLEQLDAGGLADRAAVSARIINERRISDETIFFTIMSAPALTPEQHDRLLQIAERRRLDQPGVIGIWIDTVNPPPLGVGVRNVMVEAPAFEVLLAGDVILSINGHRIGKSEPARDLQFAVAAGRAGDRLEMEILRDGKLAVIETQLADPRRLPDFVGSSLAPNRREQWAAIRSAVSRPPVKIPLVDDNGNELIDLDNSALDPSAPAAVRDRRQSRLIEIALLARINRLQDLESTSRRLAEMTSSGTLRRALEIQLRELRREETQAVQELEQFKLSLLVPKVDLDFDAETVPGR